MFKNIMFIFPITEKYIYLQRTLTNNKYKYYYYIF